MNPSARRYLLLMILGTSLFNASAQTEPLRLQLRSRSRENNDFKLVERKAKWDPAKTALIICDMWDNHWCKSAAARVAAMADPLNETIKAARAKGVFIIHAPSTCT